MATCILKTCYRCKESKSITDFGYSSRFKDNLRKECKVCGRVESLAYRNANLEQQRQSKRDWAAKNHEMVLEYSKSYYAKNREDILPKARVRVAEYKANNAENVAERRREYFAANRDRLMASKRAANKLQPDQNRKRASDWAKRHPHLMSARNAARKATKLRATPVWADSEAIKEVYLHAKRMTEETGVAHHVDHFLPLISPIVCGFHCESNLRVITASENYSKGNRMPDWDGV